MREKSDKYYIIFYYETLTLAARAGSLELPLLSPEAVKYLALGVVPDLAELSVPDVPYRKLGFLGELASARDRVGKIVVR